MEITGTNKETLAKLLTRLRNEAGMTQENVITATDGYISRGMISRLEAGTITRIQVDIISALCKVYGVRLEDVMEIAKQPSLPSTPTTYVEYLKNQSKNG